MRSSSSNSGGSNSKETDKETVNKSINKSTKSIPASLTAINRPGAFSRAYLAPGIPLRRAKAFRHKRKKLITRDVAETVDFKDIISSCARFQNSGEHSIPNHKPIVSERAVAAAIRASAVNDIANKKRRVIWRHLKIFEDI